MRRIIERFHSRHSRGGQAPLCLRRLGQNTLDTNQANCDEAERMRGGMQARGKRIFLFLGVSLLAIVPCRFSRPQLISRITAEAGRHEARQL